MKCFFIFALIATSVFGKTFHGVAHAPTQGMFEKVEIVLVYDAGGKSKISIRWDGKDRFVDSDFIVTQKPAAQDSLIGYFTFEGSPVTVRLDTWSKEKRLFLYHSVIQLASVFIGTYE